MQENPYVLALLSAARDYGRVQAATVPALAALGETRVASELAFKPYVKAQATFARGDHADSNLWDARELARKDWLAAESAYIQAESAYSDVEQQYNDAERALNAAAIALYAAEEA